MKRILILAAMMLTAFSCAPKKVDAPKILVLYYSQTSNTRSVATQIADKLGADLEEIIPVAPYDGDFRATIERSRQEFDGGVLPEIQPLQKNIADYDIVFLGFPVWFGTCANPLGTVLALPGWAGKKVVPFCTFGSGGLDSASHDIAEKLADSEVLPGYGVRAARLAAAPAEIDRFLKAGGFLEGEYEPLPEFPEAHEATEEEAAIFDAAVGDYPMMHAKAAEVAARAIPGGTEYFFTALDTPGFEGENAEPRTIKVYVIALEGQAPEFTQVIR